jgi:hypothetical protein
MEENEEFTQIFKFQMGWREFLMEFQPLFREDVSFIEDGKRMISLTPVFALIERMAKERGFTVDLDKHFFDWREDWIYILEEKKL